MRGRRTGPPPVKEVKVEEPPQEEQQPQPVEEVKVEEPQPVEPQPVEEVKIE